MAQENTVEIVKRITSSMPDVHTSTYDNLMLILHCSGDRSYAAFSKCITTLPILIGVDAIENENNQSTTLENFMAINKILCNLANTLMVAIYQKETPNVLGTFSNQDNAKMSSMRSLINYKSELESLWAQVAIKNCIIPFICGILSNIPLLYVLDEDITDFCYLLSISPESFMTSFLPTFSKSGKKIKMPKEKRSAMKKFLGLMTFFSKSQIPMGLFCLEHVKAMTQNPQMPHEFVQ